MYSKLPLSKSTAGGADSINAQSTAGKTGIAAAAATAQQQQHQQSKPAINPNPEQREVRAWSVWVLGSCRAAWNAPM